MRQNKQKSMIGLSVVMALLLGILVTVSTSFVATARRELYEEKANYLTEVSDKNAMLIHTKVTDLLGQMESLAQLIGQADTLDVEQTLKQLKQLTATHEFKRIGIIDEEGLASTTDGYQLDFSSRDYFKKAMAGECNVSDRLLDVVDHQAISVFAVPIVHRGIVDSVLFGTKNTNAMAELLNVNSFQGNGYSYIIQSNGEPVIFSLNPKSLGIYDNLFDEVAKSPGNEKAIELLRSRIAAGEDGLTTFLRDGVERQVSFAKIGINDWYMVSAVETSLIAQGSTRLISGLIGGAIGVFLVMVLICFVIVRGISRNNRRLEEMAFRDRVTGFGNWNSFQVQAEAHLQKRPGRTYAMVSADVDHFKIFNDHFGHQEGNQLLKTLAEQIAGTLGEQECFARVSADTFGLLVVCGDEQEVCRRMEALAAGIFGYRGGYHVQLSFGVLLIEDRSMGVRAMYDRASMARETVKNRADVHFACYNEYLRGAMLRDNEIEIAMANALKAGEFQVYLQPKYALETGKMVGCEALVRWLRPNKGLVFPDEFIPLFEKNGFIKQLDLYMFRQACLLLRKWGERGQQGTQLTISVNLSRVHLSNEELPGELLAIAEELGVSTAQIELELTESALFGDVPKLIRIMEGFKQVGFGLSIDDFGSGYSSLNTLKDLPVDIVKLDRAFLQNATDHRRGRIIVKSLLDMTHALSLQTVAEGVETAEQRAFLREMGCDIAQGYFFARPMPVEEFEKLLFGAEPPRLV